MEFFSLIYFLHWENVFSCHSAFQSYNAWVHIGFVVLFISFTRASSLIPLFFLLVEILGLDTFTYNWRWENLEWLEIGLELRKLEQWNYGLMFSLFAKRGNWMKESDKYYPYSNRIHLFKGKVSSHADFVAPKQWNFSFYYCSIYLKEVI